MSVLVKALGYYSHKGGKATRGLSKVKAHLKYLQHGKTHRNEPVGFDRDNERVARADFYAKLEAQPDRGVIAHKLVISLSEDERDRLGLTMRDLVRETMAGYEAKAGRSLDWIAYEHDDPGHPHVHVVVAGYDKAGKQVGFYPKDLDQLRRSAEREKDRLAELSRASGLTREDRAALRPDPPQPSREVGHHPALAVLEGLQRVIHKLLHPERDRSIDRDR